MRETTNIGIKEQREYAWSYFHLHANQRMTSFNFFVVIAALLTTGLTRALDNDFNYPIIGALLGVSLIAMSFIFWKMDQRIKYLLKHAEEALKEIETALAKDPANAGKYAMLFTAEEERTANLRVGQSFKFWRWHLSYANCFSLVYFLFCVLGIIGAIIAGKRLV